MLLGLCQTRYSILSLIQENSNELIDIWASFSIGRLTLIPTESWEITRCGLDVPIQDSYSKLAIWIVARIVNELSKRPSDINLNTLQDFWEELQAWVVERPLSVRCVMEVESSGDSPFPTILFSNPSAGMKVSIIAQTLALANKSTQFAGIYTTMLDAYCFLRQNRFCIQLLPWYAFALFPIFVIIVTNVYLMQASPICHARRIIAISMTNNDPYVLTPK